MNNLVSILILNWNRKEETCRALESALNQTYQNIEIIIIDNGSTDGSSELIQKKFPSIRYIQLDKNYGCPGGRNRGLTYCNGDFIFFCDNDGVLHTKAIENAVNCILQDENVAVVAGLYKRFKDESDIDTSFFLPLPSHNETNIFIGGVSLHRNSIYSKIGNFPDDYMYGSEETYLSFRILDAGYKIIKCDQVIVWHNQSEIERDYSKETILKWGNKLVNAYRLFPIEYFLLFVVYFFTVYPFYALQNGVFSIYVKTMSSFIKRLRNYERKPVERITFWKFRKMNS